LSEIGRKNVEILGEKMAKPLVPIVEEVETQLIEKEGCIMLQQMWIWRRKECRK
jgi:hypothetical protein